MWNVFWRFENQIDNNKNVPTLIVEIEVGVLNASADFWWRVKYTTVINLNVAK